MKSYGLVIDESLQPNISFIKHQRVQQTGLAFPTQTFKSDNTQSYSTVLEQSINTQDKPLLKELLIESEQKMMVNSVASINVSKISGLLGLIEEFLYEDSQNTQKYSLWLREIVSRHLGVILSNRKNNDVICRIRKFIQKRAGERDTLVKIKTNLKIKQSIQKKIFEPKFKYVETIEQENEGGEQLIQEDFFNDEDLLLDQLDE